jgi:hypothetical protein
MGVYMGLKLDQAWIEYFQQREVRFERDLFVVENTQVMDWGEPLQTDRQEKNRQKNVIVAAYKSTIATQPLLSVQVP